MPLPQSTLRRGTEDAKIRGDGSDDEDIADSVYEPTDAEEELAAGEEIGGRHEAEAV